MADVPEAEIRAFRRFLLDAARGCGGHLVVLEARGERCGSEWSFWWGRRDALREAARGLRVTHRD